MFYSDFLQKYLQMKQTLERPTRRATPPMEMNQPISTDAAYLYAGWPEARRSSSLRSRASKSPAGQNYHSTFLRYILTTSSICRKHTILNKSKRRSLPHDLRGARTNGNHSRTILTAALWHELTTLHELRPCQSLGRPEYFLRTIDPCFCD